METGVDPLWLATPISVNLPTSLLTPPFGRGLSIRQGLAPSGVTTRHLHPGLRPFGAMPAAALVSLSSFSPIASGQPAAMGG